jgi:ATP-dependent helicase/nuclease subunit B
MTRLFTLPFGLPFVDTLAGALLDEARGDPLALAATEIYLPTRRACRALSDAFLRRTGGRPLLLPRLIALGELGDDDSAGSGLDDSLDLAPVIPPLARRLSLARLVRAMASARDGHPTPVDQAVWLAADLARLLDEAGAERLDFSALARLVPEDLAGHWQATLDFLTILSEAWPNVLAAQGAIEPALRLERAVAARISAWRARPPGHPVIVAGSTGSRPVIRDLIKAVTELPDGRVVLPGLDRDLDAASWAALDPTHPQHGLKLLLDHMGVERDQVRALVAERDPTAQRSRLLAEAMRPAATCEAWRDLGPWPADTLAGLSRLDAPTPAEEAGAIALILREALETPGRTAALITPDRALARRVGAELERWGLAIDDSAGRPLAQTEPGSFLRLVIAMVAEDFAPVPLLACLKHPLAAVGRDPAVLRAQVRRIEIAALRGPRPAPGPAGLAERLIDRPLIDLVDDLDTLTAPLRALLNRTDVAPADLVRAHMELAEALATEPRLPGPARLWAGEAGEAAARFVVTLTEAAPALGPIDGRAYGALFEALIAEPVVRSAWDTHPRLFLWGPLEARLQRPDLVILGGLNEGTWPAAPDADPWMSRPMRQAFGLPAAERRVGLAAHDFAEGFAAPRVVLTRAVRVDGTPTVPSRWLLRLDAVMEAAGIGFGEESTPWLLWHRQLDQPPAWVRPLPPAPCPPLAARPRRLSVTEIETWMRDPYAIYARHVLGLRPLDPIDADAGAAEYGSLVHKALERFLKTHPGRLPADPEAALVAIGQQVFAEALAAPSVWAFWWPRFCAIAGWVARIEAERRPDVAAIFAEVKGSLQIDAPGGPFTLVAKADRIDHRRDGGLDLIDYKTGQPPSVREVAAGFAPQLPLEAAIARAGGFEGIPAAAPARLLYWRLKGGAEGGEERNAGPDPAGLADAALDGLAALLAAFDDPATPYGARPHPEHAPKYSDYLHLARVREWADGADDGDE